MRTEITRCYLCRVVDKEGNELASSYEFCSRKEAWERAADLKRDLEDKISEESESNNTESEESNAVENPIPDDLSTFFENNDEKESIEKSVPVKPEELATTSGIVEIDLDDVVVSNDK